MLCRSPGGAGPASTGGVIVNVSSGAATLGAPHEYVHYAAAKAGVDALTWGWPPRWLPAASGSTAVAPGIVRTDIHAAAGDAGRLERVASRVPLGRVGEPDEIATAIAWLLSDACPYATGADLRVAGGTMRVLLALGRQRDDRPGRSRPARGPDRGCPGGDGERRGPGGPGVDVVLTHGNGPQVGNLLVKNELAASVVPPVPLDWCGAQTQATLGFDPDERARRRASAPRCLAPHRDRGDAHPG